MSCLTSKLENLLGLNKSKRKTRRRGKRRISKFLNTKRINNMFRRKRNSRRSRRTRRRRR